MVLGGSGFVAGITVCIAYNLPFPPLAVTEIGALLGGCLGALAGYASCFASGRTALRGMAWGAGVGVPVGLLTQGFLGVLAWLGCVVVATLLGYQAGCTGLGGSESAWRLHKS
jgi:hypothetical protein